MRSGLAHPLARAACVALALLAAGPASALTAEEQANAELVQRYFHLMFEVHDTDAAAALLADGYVSHHQPPETKAQMLARFRRQQGERRPDPNAPRQPPEHLIAQGELVFMLLGMPPRPDRPGDTPKRSFELYRVKGGQLVEHWDAFTDAAPALPPR